MPPCRLLRRHGPPWPADVSWRLSRIARGQNCKDAEIDAIDLNWAKLAAKGFSILISSGDSGSGYTKPSCAGGATSKRGVEITEGTLISSLDRDQMECCDFANDQASAKGWTWKPPPQPTPPAAARRSLELAPRSAGGATFDHALFHLEYSMDPTSFPPREVYVLSGSVAPDGGVVKLTSENGTFLDTSIIFSARAHDVDHNMDNRNISANLTIGGRTQQWTGRAECLSYVGQAFVCNGLVWEKLHPHREEGARFASGPLPPPPPPKGNCTLYSAVRKTAPSTDHRVVSGGPAIEPHGIVSLYPSWPASSPWVTAVGATRFVGQKEGQPEMASDQFGSGGGFSPLFNQSHASWQAAAVAAYVAQGHSLPRFPPAGSFPALGRATPDVSALGEGYAVYVHGKVELVGGTSASSPAFAGMVSLLNEARLKAGKPTMGWLNPFLYANPGAFFDVVRGTNAIGRGTGNLTYGFAAAPGWDAATGLGTPHFGRLLAAALNATE